MAKLGYPMMSTIDEALELTGFGKFNYFVIIFAGLVLNSVILESVGISFALPVLECDLNLTYNQQGVLGAVSFIGIIASSHIWGFLADTTGRKKIMRPALLMGFVVTVISSFSPNFETLVVMRFLNGFLLSAGSATVFAYLGEFHCQKYRDRAILSAALISAFSALFFPIIAWFFINQNWALEVPSLDIVYKPWRFYMLACGIPELIVVLLLTYLPESPKYLLSVGKNDEAIRVIKHIYKWNSCERTAKTDDNGSFNLSTLISDEDTSIRSTLIRSNTNAVTKLVLSMWHQTAPLFMRTHVKKTCLASLIQFIIFFTAHGVYMWFPFILDNSMKFMQRYSNPICLCDILQFTQSSNFTISENELEPVCLEHLQISTYKHTFMLEVIYVSLLMSVSYAIGKFGRKPILFTILLVCGSCGILALIVKIPLVSIYLFVILLCCGLATTVVNAIVVDIYPTNLRAMAVCISLMMGRIGSVMGSNVLGALIDIHCNAALYSSAGSLIFAGFLSLFLPKPLLLNENQERI